ncbi:MAG: argD [Bacteriovoracaceae bacterium]|nr:argD [Bacteriovoracaceae bacterium]
MILSRPRSHRISKPQRKQKDFERLSKLNVRSLDQKYLARDSDPKDIEVVKTSGSFVFDANGKRYIDFVMGWCVGNLGWGLDPIKNKLKSFKGPDYVTPSMLYKRWAELANLLADITPGNLKKSFRATGGTEAVEVALNAAISHTKRIKFVSIDGCYHGDSLATMSLSSDFPKGGKNSLLDCKRIKPPLDKKATGELERVLQKKDVAAFIMEPIICNLGVLIPDSDFMKSAQQLCRKYGSLLIMDEVATGFGRTGKLFASEHYDLEPDILCLAKAITGGYAALGATVTTEEVAKSVEYYYSTYGWHPLSVEAAIANVQYWLKHRDRIEENTNSMSEYFSERLENMPFKSAPNIRIKGLAIGINFHGDENYGSKIVETAEKKGLLLSESENGFTLFPALNIERAVAEEGLTLLEESL